MFTKLKITIIFVKVLEIFSFIQIVYMHRFKNPQLKYFISKLGQKI